MSTRSSSRRTTPNSSIKPSKASSVCEQVILQYGQTTSTCRALIETLIRNHSLISLDYTPLETFAKEQSVRAMTDVHRRLIAAVLTKDEVVEHITNILSSFNLYRARYSLAGAVMALKCLQAFISAISEFCCAYEYIASQPATNWEEYSKACEQQLQDLKIRTLFQAVDFIPHMHELQSVRILGGGGFGVVYEAIHLPTETRVCVKLIITSKLKRLSYAALDKIVAAVAEDPKLVQYYASFLATQAYVTIMEYVGGVDVMKFITAIGEVLDMPEYYVVILGQMAKAIEHLHMHGFIHRDIKPQNALILPGGHIKLIDFDTCKICMAHFIEQRTMQAFFERTANEFEDKDYAGTLPFMAPEIIERRPYGRSVDWWAVGVTAYRLLVGRMPFRHRDRDELKDWICKREPTYPERLPAVERDFLERSLNKKALSRLGSRNYTEMIQHKLFQGYAFDINPNEAYFDTSKIPELLQAIRKKSMRKKAKDMKYMKIKNCVNVLHEEQKNLLVYSSIPWRKLVRPDDAIFPEKTDDELDRDLEMLLQTPDIVPAETPSTGWVTTTDLSCPLVDQLSSNITSGPTSSLQLNSRFEGSLNDLIKVSGTYNTQTVQRTPATPMRLRSSSRKPKKKKCKLM